VERGHWLDILIALIEYLRSGDSKVGFLNKAMGKNMLDKGVEDRGVERDMGDGIGEIPSAEAGITKAGGVMPGEGGLRRSSRKRGLRNVEPEARDTKVRRKG
jgi:hypothetical protein